MHRCLVTRHLFIGEDDSGIGAASAAGSPVLLGVGVPVTWTTLTRRDCWRGHQAAQKYKVCIHSGFRGGRGCCLSHIQEPLERLATNNMCLRV